MLTTIQDNGFVNQRSKGIGTSGVMDKTSMRLLNILLDNSEQTEVLEMHYPGPTIKFEEHGLITLGGGDFSPKLNGSNVDSWRIQKVKPGDMLTFGKRICGARMYLAVKGGFCKKPVLGSKSTSLVHTLGGSRIAKGDVLDLNLVNGSFYNAVQKFKISPKTVCGSMRPPLTEEQEIRFIANTSIEGLDQKSIDKIFSQPFIISGSSNRMGYRLEGEKIDLSNIQEQISSAVAFGTIQLLNDGSLVILMADHQTTGGYPRLGQVITVDLPILAQLNVGQHIKLREISVEVAESVFLKQEKEIKKFKASVSMNR